jgi:hypothetical protein
MAGEDPAEQDPGGPGSVSATGSSRRQDTNTMYRPDI